jgi:hypothetical protein
MAISGSGRYATGVFKAPGGRIVSLLTNRDYRAPGRISVQVEPRGATIERFDPATRAWSPASFPVDLPAGGGVLIRWAGSL